MPTDEEIARQLVTDDGLFEPGDRFEVEVKLELREMNRRSSRIATIARIVRHFLGSPQQTVEPTEADICTLARALQLEERFDAGIFPRGGAQTSQYRKLCRYGMLRFSGEYGHDLDGEVEGELPIYVLTDVGREWIKERAEGADAAFRELMAEQEAIDWALSMYAGTNDEPKQGSVPLERLTPNEQATLARHDVAVRKLNDPIELAKLLREEFTRCGWEAREPGDKVPGKDGNFITVGLVDGVDGDLIEIDRPDQCETFTMPQARKLLANLRNGMDVNELLGAW
jgi:hypothetical protein